MEYLSYSLELGLFYANEARILANDVCIGLEPWQIMAYTFGALSVILWFQGFFESDKPLKVRAKAAFFRWAKKIPWVERKIAEEVAKARVGIEDAIHKTDYKGEFYKFLPDPPMTGKAVLAEVDAYNDMAEYEFLKGHLSGTVYSGDPELTDLLTKVFHKTAWTNPLHADVFPGCRKMEAEVVRMVCNMFHGDPNTCGTVTSGGTESLLLACLAYRNRAYDLGIDNPEIVVPVSGHAAFDKAAELFGMRITHVPLNPQTLEVDIQAMKKAISYRTCMLVGSAPGFPHGVVDPIDSIAKLGLKYGIPVHVDACLGGFLVPFMEEAGFAVKAFDFRLPGVTSISCDSHKYGFTTKGSSIIMYRDGGLRHYQYFAQPNWPGGIYATPTLSGSRCGANIATCWATMLHFGRKGYVESTKKIIEASRVIRLGIEEIEGLEVMGEPEVSVVAFASKHFNIYALSERMGHKHWNLNALQFPPGLHIAVTIHHTQKGVAERFLEDLREETKELMRNPPDPKNAEGTAAIYCSSQAIPDRSIVSELAMTFLDCCYMTTPPASFEKNRTGAKPSLTHTFAPN